MEEVDNDEADDESQRGNNFKIEKRFEADATDFLEITHLRNADHDGAEDDRCEQHANQFDECVGERFEIVTGSGEKATDGNAKDEAEKHLEIKVSIKRLACEGRGVVAMAASG